MAAPVMVAAGGVLATFVIRPVLRIKTNLIGHVNGVSCLFYPYHYHIGNSMIDNFLFWDPLLHGLA